ncbi:NAD(P)-binding protein, partial [bacterium]|nr:NAD(P)-binding protein [bacterium]
MSTETSKNLQILGGGPGGLAAAYYARKAGLKVALY